MLDVALVRTGEHLDRTVVYAAIVDGNGGGGYRRRIVVHLVVGPVVVDGEAVVVRWRAEDRGFVGAELGQRLLVVELLLHQHWPIAHQRRQRAEQPFVRREPGEIQAEVRDGLDLAHHHGAILLAANVQAPAVALVGERGVDDEFEDEVGIRPHGGHLRRGERARHYQIAVALVAAELFGAERCRRRGDSGRCRHRRRRMVRFTAASVPASIRASVRDVGQPATHGAVASNYGEMLDKWSVGGTCVCKPLMRLDNRGRPPSGPLKRLLLAWRRGYVGRLTSRHCRFPPRQAEHGEPAGARETV